jgi:hypothetical protein
MNCRYGQFVHPSAFRLLLNLYSEYLIVFGETRRGPQRMWHADPVLMLGVVVTIRPIKHDPG